MSNCYSSYQTLVTFETGIKECITDYNSLDNYVEATANSNYVSKFYQRQICQNIYEKVTKRKNIDLKIFENENSTTKADSKGVCPENYFTPDEEY